MRAGRTFAAKPKSTHHTSPGSVLFIFRFHCVKHLEPFQSALIAFGQGGGVFLCFDDTAHDFSSRFVRQLRYLCDDFCSAHTGNVHIELASVKMTKPCRRAEGGLCHNLLLDHYNHFGYYQVFKLLEGYRQLA